MKILYSKVLFVSSLIVFATSSVSAMTCTNLTKALSKGSENSEVLKLQQFLFDGGYLTAKPNGYYGDGTVKAVKKFQIESGLSQAGSVGPVTRSKINGVSCRNISGTTSVISSLKSNNTNSSLPNITVTSVNKNSVFVNYENITSKAKFALRNKNGENVGGSAFLPDLLISDKTGIRELRFKDCPITGQYYVEAIKLMQVDTKPSGIPSSKEDGVIVKSKMFDFKGFSDFNECKAEITRQLKQNNAQTLEQKAISTAFTRNSQRVKDVADILVAIYQYKDDSGKVPTSITNRDTEICANSKSCDGMINLSVLVGNYLPKMPQDPQKITVNGNGYLVSKNVSDGRIKVSAPLAEEGVVISVTK